PGDPNSWRPRRKARLDKGLARAASLVPAGILHLAEARLQWPHAGFGAPRPSCGAGQAPMTYRCRLRRAAAMLPAQYGRRPAHLLWASLRLRNSPTDNLA